MTSPVPKVTLTVLAEQPEYSEFDALHEDIIDSFLGLEAAILSQEYFKSYDTQTKDGVITLACDHLTLNLLSPNVWQSKEELQQYLSLKSPENLLILCVNCGTSKADLPTTPQEKFLHALALPLSSRQLEIYISNVREVQLLLFNIHQEKEKVQRTSENVKEVMAISRELNGVRDIPKLLHLILAKAREFTKADAGSIYTIDNPTAEIKEGSEIRFRFAQNYSVPQNLSEFVIPVNRKSIVGNVAIHAVSINLPDLYKLNPDSEKNPYHAKHDRSWDQRIGYESHSMLTVPMFDISHRLIGIIQLINRKKDANQKLLCEKDFIEQVVPFDDQDTEYAEIIAQLAGVALENARMREEIQDLFDGFVSASVKAIEQRDPTTSGHSHRVAQLTLALARAVNDTNTGPYASVTFSENEIQEIEYASLLHDIGKLGVREKVLVKANKLHPWEYDLLQERFNLIRSSYEIEYLRKFINFLQVPNLFPMDVTPEHLLQERNQRLKQLEEMLGFIEKSNQPTVLEQGGFERLKDIANYTFQDPRAQVRNYLKSDELAALSVSRGSLTRAETVEIQSHVSHTYDFLRKIPWNQELSNIPQIAAKHHEKLDGTGYPTSAEADQIPLQSRMMAIADIFDALSASDRPYKKAVPIEKALDILEMEVKAGKLDPELFKIFKEHQVYRASHP